MAFPTAIPSYLGFIAGHTLLADTHAAQHNQEQTDIIALATKMGTGASSPTANKVLRGTGTGTSSWAQTDLTTDVTGVLPVANGGTGLSALAANIATFLSSPSSANLLAALTDETGTGAAVFANSPAIVTPTIASFINATHNHQNAAGGGLLVAQALPALDLNIQTLANPHRFRAYNTAAQNSGNAAFVQVTFNVVDYDPGSNFASNTFTARVSGYYHFDGHVVSTSSAATTRLLSALYKNGALISRGTDTSSAFSGSLVSDTIKLVAGDTVALYCYGDTTRAFDVSDNGCVYFSGFLTSHT